MEILEIMARATRKPSSRRRAAALKFLSGISFETSTTPRDRMSDQVLIVEEVKQRIIQKSSADDAFEVSEFNSARFAETECYKSSSFACSLFRDRSNTSRSEYKIEQSSVCKGNHDETPHPATFSSSESITSGSGKPKPDLDPRFHKFGEMKIARANNLRNHKNDRIMLVSPMTKTPFYVFSYMPYKKTKSRGDIKKEMSTRRRNLSGSRPMSSFIDTLDPFMLLGLEKYQDEQMISYQQLLVSPITTNADTKESSCQEISNSNFDNFTSKNHQISRCMSVDLGMSSKAQSVPCSSSPLFNEFRANDWEEFGQSPESYSPFLLDDPELMSGKHRTVLTFPSYRTSVIDYVRPSDLKKELNEKFREKFPHILLTLSKLRSLKREMKKLSKAEKCVDLLTVAQAFVYFEKLILRNIINKTNRKLCAAVCLLLSAKMNDTKGPALKQLLERLESVFRLNRKDVLALEFAVVVALEFSLYAPTWEILPHYQRLVHES